MIFLFIRFELLNKNQFFIMIFSIFNLNLIKFYLKIYFLLFYVKFRTVENRNPPKFVPFISGYKIFSIYFQKILQISSEIIKLIRVREIISHYLFFFSLSMICHIIRGFFICNFSNIIKQTMVTYFRPYLLLFLFKIKASTTIYHFSTNTKTSSLKGHINKIPFFITSSLPKGYKNQSCITSSCVFTRLYPSKQYAMKILGHHHITQHIRKTR